MDQHVIPKDIFTCVWDMVEMRMLLKSGILACIGAADFFDPQNLPYPFEF